MKRTLLGGLILCGVFQFIPSPLMFAEARTEKKAASTVAAPVQGVVDGLKGCKIPVYLPSWLPKMPEPNYASAVLNPPGSDPGYVVRLASQPGDDPPQSSLLFEIYGSKAVGKGKKTGKVSLGSGRIGYLRSSEGGNAGPSIDWDKEANQYSIGKLLTKEDLIRAAKSSFVVPITK